MEVQLNTPYIGPARIDHVSPKETTEHIVKSVSKRDGTEEWVTLDFAANRVAGYMGGDVDEVKEYIEGGGRTQTISFIYYIPKAHGELLERYEQDKINRPAQYTPIK